MFCMLYRWQIAGCLDNGSPMSAGLRRHIADCATCRRFAAVHEALARRGLQACQAASLPLPEELRTRIAADVRQLATTTLPRPAPAMRLSAPVLAWGTVALVAGFALAGWLLVSPPPRQGESPPPPQHRQRIVAVPLPTASFAALAGSAGQAVNAPYDGEVAALAADVRRATGFVLDCASPVFGYRLADIAPSEDRPTP